MNPECDKQAPLTGIRVIDFGHYIAGPLTGMLLADQGAHTREILGELGYDDDFVEGLIAKGVAREQLHEYYLPH